MNMQQLQIKTNCQTTTKLLAVTIQSVEEYLADSR